MLAHHADILLTGFGPFPGVAVNLTSALVPFIADAARQRFPSLSIADDVLPTEWTEGPRRLDALFEKFRPRLSIHFGVSASAKGFQIETQAVNVCSDALDAAGLKSHSAVVTLGGQEVRAASWPAARIEHRLRQLKLPCQLSENAGRYLCNTALYRALGNPFGTPEIAGFVHLPRTLIEKDGGDGLTQHQAIDGALEIISVCLDQVAAAPEALAVNGI